MRIMSASIVSCLGFSALAADLPVREVTIFKDGHALVLREGEIELDARGDAVLTDLPQPVLGTFWPYSADDRARLIAATAEERVVESAQDVRNLREFVEANVGRRMTIRSPHLGLITGVARRVMGPVEQPMVVFEMGQETRVFELGHVQVVTLDEPAVQTTVSRKAMKPHLELDLAWSEGPPESANVGVMYVQRGLRWIPGYRITLDGEGKARLELQATLVNELHDLENVRANLVVGVPRFLFKETVDPMALQQAIAPLGPYFDADGRTASAFSNALMTQGRMREARGHVAPSAPTGPELTGGEHAEDLFVFSLKGVTLAKGARMVVPVASFELAYEDVFTFEAPIEPPAPFWSSYSSEQLRDITAMLERPNVRHAIRLTNTADAPITTAPAMVMLGDRVLAQGMTTFAAPGASLDLEITDAVDIVVDIDEREVKRSLNSINIDGYSYHEARLEGTMTIRSHRGEPVRIEARRFVLGNLDEVSEGVEHRGMSVFSNRAFGAVNDRWRHHNWPWWWMRVNGSQELVWTTTLEPGEEQSISWRWHYLWR